MNEHEHRDDRRPPAQRHGIEEIPCLTAASRAPLPCAPLSERARLATGLVACLTLLACGWTGLLIPSLIRSIEATFGQTDAGIGIVYLVYALAYASGSFAGGALTERLGRRLVLGGAVLVTGLGAAGLGLAPTWAAFIAGGADDWALVPAAWTAARTASSSTCTGRAGGGR